MKVWKIIGKIILIPFTAVVAVIITLALVMNTFVNGNSPAAKSVFITTVLETGQFKFLAGLFLSEDEINEVVNNNSMESFNEEVNASLITINRENLNAGNQEYVSNTDNGSKTEEPVVDEFEAKDTDGDGIVIEIIAGRTFKGTMMIVKDPKRVGVYANYPWQSQGITLDQLVKDAGAVGGINGGLYNSYNNSGGNPYGIAVADGKILRNKPREYNGLVLIGLTEDDILVIEDVSKMSEAESEKFIKEKKIRDAVCFQEELSDKNNHFVQLIINGKERELNGMGSGLNPRTAIGQRADGALLLLVTDGRGASGHIGASAADLIAIMKEYGAVNAANIDGGSSSCMYYNDSYLMTSVTFYHANDSWKLPLAFVVK